MYQDDPAVFDQVIDMVVDDWQRLESEGIRMPGQCEGTVYPILLGNKGDWSYLVPWLHLLNFVR